MCFIIMLRTLDCFILAIKREIKRDIFRLLIEKTINLRELIMVSRTPWVSSGIALLRKGAGENCCVLFRKLMVAGAVMPPEVKFKSGDIVV